jgi:hypothetical protein
MQGSDCFLAPTTQFQCDLGAKPIPGFSINSQGELEYKGDSSFIACETGQNGGMNIYTENSTDVTQCVDVTLNADSCAGAGAGGGAGGPGAGPSGTASAVPSGPSGVPGHPGAGPSGTSGVPGGPGVGPSGPSGGAGGPGSDTIPGSTSLVSVATPSSSAPGAGGGGGGGGGAMTGSPGAESSAGGAGGGFKTTIRTTETVTVCPTAGGQPSGPIAGGGGAASTGPGAGGAPSGTPSGPVAGGGGAATSPGAGGAPGTPTGPGAGGQATSPGAGAQPTGPGAGGGGPSGPGGGGQPSGPGAGGAGGEASCPIDSDLSGDYEFPHLIIPVDSSAPNKAPGTALNGTVTDTVSTIFNFDIPKSDAGKTCNLVFLFPEQHELETSAFSFSGNGKIDFAKLSGDATQSTCYSNRPEVAKDYGVTKVSPGNSYLIATFSCPAGETVSFEMSDAGTTELEYFQDYNPKP